MLATDYYLQSVDVRQFVEKARLLIFQLYCRIHSRVKLECVVCGARTGVGGGGAGWRVGE